MYKIIQGIFFIALGALFLGVGISTYYKYAQINSIYMKTSGKVVALVNVPQRNNAVWPKIKFKDAKGKTYEFTSELIFKPTKISKGEVLQLLYEPQNPNKAFLYNAFNLLQLPWMLIITGAFMLLGGGMVLRQYHKRKQFEKS